ncbi:hypothetical protein EVAR_9219_1, partial [Eumeta japonica]
ALIEAPHRGEQAYRSRKFSRGPFRRKSGKPETTWSRGPGSRSPRTTRDTSGDTGAEGEPGTVYRSPLRLMVPERGSKNPNRVSRVPNRERMSTRRVAKGASTSKSEREPNVPKGGPRVGTVAKKKIVSQKIMTTPPVPCTPPETAGDGAKNSHEKRARGTEDVLNDGTVAAEFRRQNWWRLRQTGEPQRRNRPPVLPASGRPTPVDLSGVPAARTARQPIRTAGRPPYREVGVQYRDSAMEARSELEASSPFASRSPARYVMELERERARRAREAEAAEKRIAKIAKENLDRILQIENKIDKMAGEVSSTRNLLGHFDVPEKLEAIQKTLEAGTARAHLTTQRWRRSRNPWMPPPKGFLALKFGQERGTRS